MRCELRLGLVQVNLIDMRFLHLLWSHEGLMVQFFQFGLLFIIVISALAHAIA